MMIPLLLLVSALGADTTKVDTSRVLLPPPPVAIDATPQDTQPRRRRAVEVSEWYGRRLMIHRALSYAVIPVFAVQWYAGEKLYATGVPIPSWAKPVHQVGAGTVAGIFGVNTVTGLWNLWDSRHTPEHRALRTTHALLMLAADGAFAYTGIKLSQDADSDLDKRRQHRAVALAAMGVTVGSGVIMKIFNK